MQVNHKPSYEGTYKANSVKALHDNVLVKDMNFEERVTAGGIILRSDDGTSDGVRPRWAEVYAVGSKQTDVKVGQWVYVEHGRWTRGVQIEDSEGNTFKIRKVDKDSILLVSDEDQSDFSDK
jgi:co-chaperonin GroES (HSP10)